MSKSFLTTEYFRPYRETVEIEWGLPASEVGLLSAYSARILQRIQEASKVDGDFLEEKAYEKHSVRNADREYKTFPREGNGTTLTPEFLVSAIKCQLEIFIP